MIKRAFARIKRMKLLLLALAIGTYATISYSFTDNYFEISKNLDIFSTVLRELDLYYVDTIRPNDLVKTGIDAMLNSLDPYTDYIPESEIEDYKFMTTGEYGGIGSLVQEDSGYIEIAEPYEDSPASKAGLKAGDKVVSIDGIDIRGKNTIDVGKLLKGQPATSVKLMVIHPGTKDPVEITVMREVIKVSNVPYYGMVSNNIGYIRLTEFTQEAGKNVRNALTELKKNSSLQGVILDLRNNPGGLLNEAINVANVFEPKGQLVVNTRGRMKEWNHTDYTTSEPIDTNIPVAVLVNSGSASASEIVTGTIQDLDRGVIIGTRTYGKGLVQQTRPLSYDAQLKFTIAKYYIPSGRCIQALDYSRRSADGSANKVPDSLKMAFRTKHGRIVYDGGGIDPDLKKDPGKYNVVTIKLESQPQYIIFHYATDYVMVHPTIDKPDKFSLTDDEYNKFVAYAKSQSFQYTTKSEQLLAQLKESTQTEKYFDDLKGSYDRIKSDIEDAKKNDLIKNKDEIKRVLEAEIMSRYYYEKGRIQTNLRYDDEVAKGIEVLNNKKEYDSVITTVASPIRPFHDPAMNTWPPSIKR
jgi:carboxyl-terminal processing protease